MDKDPLWLAVIDMIGRVTLNGMSDWLHSLVQDQVILLMQYRQSQLQPQIKPTSSLRSNAPNHQSYKLKLLHQLPLHRPHACPLPKYVHRNRSQKAGNLYPSNGNEDSPSPIALQPVHNEEREYHSMEDI